MRAELLFTVECSSVLAIRPSTLFRCFCGWSLKGEEVPLAVAVFISEIGDCAMKCSGSMFSGRGFAKYVELKLCPQTTFKKTLCLRKHCVDECFHDTAKDLRFWTDVLARKPVDAWRLAEHLHSLSDDMRVAVWDRFACSSADYDRTPASNDSDEGIARSVVQVCRDNGIESTIEEDVFRVYKNILRSTRIAPNSFVIRLAIHVLGLPHADEFSTFQVLHKFLSTLAYSKACGDRRSRTLLHSFINKGSIFQFMDVCICFDLTFDDFVAHAAQLGDAGIDCEIPKLVKLCLDSGNNNARNAKLREVDSRFDLLVLQNESKVCDGARNRLGDRIRDLEKDNAELSCKNENLADNLQNMEMKLNAFNVLYVDELKKILHDLTKRCEQLEKENKALVDANKKQLGT